MSWNESSIADMPEDWNAVRDGAALLFFSIDTCPHCVRIKPVMETVAKTLGSVVPVLKAGGDSPMASTLGVTGFPTLMFVDPFGVATEYKGERTADAISSFVCNNPATRGSPTCAKFF